MASITIVNNDLAALGLWDVDRRYHVARGLGGTMVLDPDTESRRVIDLLSEVGSIAAVDTTAPVCTRGPEITGTAAVGETLTLDLGDWDGAESFVYSWEIGGTPVEGADGLTLVVPVGSVGQWVTAVVTATGPGGTTTVETDQFGPVAGG